jgi:beta-1,4-mannosyltransferase
MPAVSDPNADSHLARRLDVALTDVATTADNRDPCLLGYFPRPRRNPFQAVLYNQLASRGIAALNLTSAELPAFVQLRRGEGPVGLHLHWTYPVLRDCTSARDAERTVDRFLSDLDSARDAQMALLWTVHNVLPHDCAYPVPEARLRAGVAMRSDLVHVMCPATLELASPYYDLPKERTRVIPHPTYTGWYPTEPSPPQARAELGVAPDSPTFVFVGSIRAYKGLDNLLSAFERVRSRWPGQPRPRLLIAGRPSSDVDAAQLKSWVQELEGASMEPRHVDETRLATYLNAADVVVLPYENILNSGVLMAALTFRRTVVVPQMGCLPFMVTNDVASCFEPGSIDSLAAAMARSISLARTPDQPRRVGQVAARYSPELIGSLFAATVESVLRGKPVPGSLGTPTPT